ncbi:acetyltransferase [Microlunatus soli]|uniref:Sugar O-acyltransferase, sialic acid O-acetyltransferase NeuD family n=1 Tax=Microlunatus soli TaxID=630515 RepID=A0A1H1SMS6_9ACTN|nr:acetyltransferase [Microlunatus soli]SDS49272.1 sugar O-acyltransferase, sialic acid O-acetyltransferase NeuD family [Microlunatus soli]
MAVLLVGAGGLAREVIAVLREAGRDLLGVVDDRHSLLPPTLSGVPVLGGIDDVVHYPDAEVIICVGSGETRAAISERMSLAPGRYISVLDPSVRNPAGCPIGEGSILLAGVTLTADVEIGAHVVAMPHVTIPHDCVVDDFATFASGVALGGGVQVGRAAYLGMNAAVLPGRKIGAGATVGMGAVVLDDVPDGQTWAGVPARRLESD